LAVIHDAVATDRGERAGRRAVVAVVGVAVVALFVGSEEAVATGRDRALRGALGVVGVLLTVVALLVLGVDQAVATDRGLARERAVAGVAVVVAEVALFGRVDAHEVESVAAGRRRAQGRALVVVVGVAVVAELGLLDDPVAAALDLTLC